MKSDVVTVFSMSVVVVAVAAQAVSWSSSMLSRRGFMLKLVWRAVAGAEMVQHLQK